MRLTVQVSGLRGVGELLGKAFSARRLSAAAATALTRTAGLIVEAEKTEMRRVFDRPTPYTLGAVGMKAATAQRPIAEVFLKTAGTDGRAASKWLAPQVSGGRRPETGLEKLLQRSGHMPTGWRIVPGAGADLDVFGNVQRRQVSAIVASLRNQAPSLGPQRKNALGRRIRAARKAGGEYFSIPPGRKRMTPGVYIREFGGRNITPVLIFVRTALYERRFDFEGVATRTAQQHLVPEFRRAMTEHVEKIKAELHAAAGSLRP